jgi:hypothetical protein
VADGHRICDKCIHLCGRDDRGELSIVRIVQGATLDEALSQAWTIVQQSRAEFEQFKADFLRDFPDAIVLHPSDVRL